MRPDRQNHGPILQMTKVKPWERSPEATTHQALFKWINEILGVTSILVLSPCIRTIKSSFAWRSWWQEGSWVCLDHLQNAHKLVFHSFKTFMKQNFYLSYQSPWAILWEKARTHCPVTDHEPVSQPRKPLAHMIILNNVGHKNWIALHSNVTFPSFFLWP